MNVTVSRSLHHELGEVYINFIVDRIRRTPTPITIDVYLEGRTQPLAFQCENGSITDVLNIVFKTGCEDPVVIVNETATVTLGMEVHVKYMNLMCDHITIGPQREYPSSAHI